jgi:transcriptional regulator with XRE-family HTH domain
VTEQQKVFIALGRRIRELRKRADYSQEDMITHGFSARHWQKIEKGRPITVSTLLRICHVFRTPMSRLVRGLDSNFIKQPLTVAESPKKQ